MQAARERGDKLTRVAVGLGIGGLLATVCGLIAQLPDLAGTGVVIGMVAIVVARSTRRRAVTAKDGEQAYLGRFGQVTGWLAVAPFVVLVAAIIILTGLLMVFFVHVR
jgi:hypothetical protein